MYDWLKFSPEKPKLDTKQKRQKNGEGSSKSDIEGFEKHQFKYCYPAELLNVPEFVYESKTTILKAKEVVILEEYLLEREAHDARIAAEAGAAEKREAGDPAER